MATSLLHVSLLLAVLGVTHGQTATPDDSQCSCTFKLPVAECGRTPVNEQFMTSSIIALQTQMTQMNLVMRTYWEDIRKITEENQKLRQTVASNEAAAIQDRDENVKLRQKLETFESGRNRSVVNVKQCSKRGLNDDKKYGLVFSCDFVKKRSYTVLRVVWNGDIRLIDTGHKGTSARRWFFTINGKECSDPRTIDTQLAVQDSDSNNHRPAYVEGYCRGIPAGDVNVAWNVGDVVSGEGWDQSNYNTGASYTGWVATVRIIVEEVDVESANTVIV